MLVTPCSWQGSGFDPSCQWVKPEYPEKPQADKWIAWKHHTERLGIEPRTFSLWVFFYKPSTWKCLTFFKIIFLFTMPATISAITGHMILNWWWMAGKHQLLSCKVQTSNLLWRVHKYSPCCASEQMQEMMKIVIDISVSVSSQVTTVTRVTEGSRQTCKVTKWHSTFNLLFGGLIFNTSAYLSQQLNWFFPQKTLSAATLNGLISASSLPICMTVMEARSAG